MRKYVLLKMKLIDKRKNSRMVLYLRGDLTINKNREGRGASPPRVHKELFQRIKNKYDEAKKNE